MKSYRVTTSTSGEKIIIGLNLINAVRSLPVDERQQITRIELIGDVYCTPEMLAAISGVQA